MSRHWGPRMALWAWLPVQLACTYDLQEQAGQLGAGPHPPSEVLAPAAMRRLTHSEYNRSVQQLLGTTLQPADVFPPDPVADGFDNSGEVQVLTSADLDARFLAAHQLAQEATEPAALQRLAPCADVAQPARCVAAFVASFGPLAWRRPLDEQERAELAALAAGLGPATYAEQVGALVATFLLSANFLFLADPEAADASAASGQRLGAYALASRLSYFLWSSPPDAALYQAAADGSLITDAGLRAQAARMLADGRASALVDDFAGQWMQLRVVAQFTPDAATHPRWSPQLRAQMIEQTRLTLRDLVAGQLALPELLTGSSTYLSAPLATYYGLPKVEGQGLSLTPLPAGSRRGLLGHGAILANSSFPLRTSLTRRGKFVLDQLLCAPVPPPPNNAATLDESGPVSGSRRTIMAAHATIPACSVCHSFMDPYGYVMEVFDAVGARRADDHGFPIDAHATLPDGFVVDDIEGLQAHLAADPRLAACAVQKLYTYAMARSVADDDHAVLDHLGQVFVGGGQKFPALLTELILSESFRSRRSP